MTSKTNKILLTPIIVAFGAIMLTSTMTSETQANTKIEKRKLQGDFFNYTALDESSPTMVLLIGVFTSLIDNKSSEVFFRYSVAALDVGGFSGITVSCIADSFVLKGSGTSKLEFNIDTTNFVPVSGSPTHVGECVFTTIIQGDTPPSLPVNSPAGIVFVEVQRDGLWENQLNGKETSCFTSGIKTCERKVGNSESGSAQINSGNILGFDVSAFTTTRANVGKQNVIFQTWEEP